MNVLVVGGAGYIGAHIVDLLCVQGYNVIVLDNLNTGFKENINSSSKFIQGDILNKNDLKLIFNDYKFDGLIHMAALKAVGDSMVNPGLYTENNIVGSINLITEAVKHGIKNIIFSSTAAVYGEPIYNPIDEKHPTQPINHYGFTKLAIENYLNWMNKMHGINYAALRYFNAAGYSTDRSLIKFKEKNPQNLLPIVMEVANGTRESFDVYGNDYNTEDGTCIRDYIHVLDLADAHIKALENLASSNSKKITLNLSTGSGYSVLEVINTAEKSTGKKIKYNVVDRREGDPEVLISSNSKAKKVLDWDPLYSSLEEIISSMWIQYKV